LTAQQVEQQRLVQPLAAVYAVRRAEWLPVPQAVYAHRVVQAPRASVSLAVTPLTLVASAILAASQLATLHAAAHQARLSLQPLLLQRTDQPFHF
jgi:hypothetical protein